MNHQSLNRAFIKTVLLAAVMVIMAIMAESVYVSADSQLDGAVDIQSFSCNEYSIDEPGSTAVFRFTVPEDGEYFVYSERAEDDEASRLEGDLLVYDSESGGYENIWYVDDVNEQMQYSYGWGDKNFDMNFIGFKGAVYYFTVHFEDPKDTGSFKLYLDPDGGTASIDVQFDKASGIATVTGKAENCRFNYLYLDNMQVSEEPFRKTSFSVELDMKEFEVGYHKIGAGINNQPDDKRVYYEDTIPTYIYETPPELDLNDFTVYKSVFYIGNDYTDKLEPRNDLLTYSCILYRKAGTSSWKINPLSTDSVEKLKPGTKYEVKMSYAEEVKVNGVKTIFTGLDTGAVTKSVYIKTAQKNPPALKSVKVKKRKYKKIDGRWYTYLTLEVALKKKPNATGIDIDSKSPSILGAHAKGNKKKYTTVLKCYDKQRKGKILNLRICSYQSNKYGGYSDWKYFTLKA